jgi:hypothetical protein
MKPYAWIKEFYGNRGGFFDLGVSIVIILILKTLHYSPDFIARISATKTDAVTSFFGILVGFLLTTLSLLFLYNPEHSESLIEVRKHPAYKKMLHSFVWAALFSLILAIVFLVVEIFPYNEILLLFAIFVLLRILKCMYYLYTIVSISFDESK